MKKNIFAVLHTIAAVAVMLIGLFCSDFAVTFLSDTPASDHLIYTAVYIIITLSLGLLYAKYVLHFSFEQIGISKLPQLKWVFAGICLPLAVTAFYVLLVNGQTVKNGESISPYLIYAVFPAGIAAGVCEEFIFRGLIMHIFDRQWNRAAAIFIPSFLFAALHILNMRMGFVDILQLLIAGTAVGVMFSLIVYQSGSIWSSAIVHALWNAIIIGGIFVIEHPADGYTANCFYRYEILSDNILLTGGRFGIESALPAVIGYCIISAAAFILLMKQPDKKTQQ